MYFCFNFYLYLFRKSYTEGIKRFNWANFENHWDLLLRDCAKAGAKETQIHMSHNFLRKQIFSKKKQNISYVTI